jgi:hypothetical protein
MLFPNFFVSSVKWTLMIYLVPHEFIASRRVKAAFPLFSSHVYTALLGSRVKPPSRTDRIQAICAQYQKPTSREMNRNSFLFFAFKQV